jgi:HEAT repeat protein
MTFRSLPALLLFTFAVGFVASPAAAVPVEPDSEKEEKKDAGKPADKLYKQGRKAVDDERWKDAAAAFVEVIRLKGARSDAAAYWLAYSMNKEGRKSEALALVQAFAGQYPSSPWLKDVRALELEIREGRGRPANPESESDDELKLMAINSLVHTDPERALPLLEKILKGRSSDELKERALFVLAQSGAPRARQIIADVARGNAHPDLQEKAIHYLGVFRGKENQQLLEEIYRSTSNVDVKEQILHAFMIAGARDRVLDAARNEKSVELRGEAAHQLGVMGARAELWQLYRTEKSREVKEEIIQGMFIAGDIDHILELARTEPDRELRLEAIQKLGVMGARTTPALWEIYRGQNDSEIREQVIQAFFVQGNAKALIEIAKTEKNRELRQEALEKLSVMNNKEATDYLLQFLKED